MEIVDWVDACQDLREEVGLLLVVAFEADPVARADHRFGKRLSRSPAAPSCRWHSGWPHPSDLVVPAAASPSLSCGSPVSTRRLSSSGPIFGVLRGLFD
jgi:hypothetical protein